MLYRSSTSTFSVGLVLEALLESGGNKSMRNGVGGGRNWTGRCVVFKTPATRSPPLNKDPVNQNNTQITPVRASFSQDIPRRDTGYDTRPTAPRMAYLPLG